MQHLISKADVLLEALPYLQRFRGRTFVVKYGGSFMDSPDAAVRNGVARDIVFLEAAGINPVVVHGGGKAITRAMDAAGLKANFIQGQRVTDEATVQVVDRVLSKEINPEVVATINSLNGQARGFAGTDIFTCRPLRMTGPRVRKLILDVSAKSSASKPRRCWTPLFRQEKMFRQQFGVELSRKTMGCWVEQAAELLKPVYRSIREDLLAGNYLQADETPIRYLDPDVKGKSQQGYLWAYSRPGGDVLFEWRVSRSREGPEEFLKDFRGKLQTDGYSVYESLAKERDDLTLGRLLGARAAGFSRSVG